MNALSDKIKIVYLTFVILFALGVFVYLLDTWGIIKLEDHIPYLKKEAPLVLDSTDNPFELEKERLRKEEDRLKDEELRLKELASKFDTDSKDLQARLEELEQSKQALEEQKKALEAEKAADVERKKIVKEMADRINNMPPKDAVEIVAGWNNADLVDVFIQMEKDSEAEGRPSIVPYLLTKMPRDRASVITSLMLDSRTRQNIEEPL